MLEERLPGLAGLLMQPAALFLPRLAAIESGLDELYGLVEVRRRSLPLLLPRPPAPADARMR